MGFLNRIVPIENIRLSPIAISCVFTDDLYLLNAVVFTPNVHHSWGHERWRRLVSKSAEGASHNSHGCSPWLLISNTFPGFGRKDANRENNVLPKRWDDDFFTENLWVF